MKTIQPSRTQGPAMNARRPKSLSRLRSALALILLPLLTGSCALLYPDVPWQRIEMPLDVTKTGNPVAWSVVLTGKGRYRLFIDFMAEDLERNDYWHEFSRLFGRRNFEDEYPGIPLDLEITAYNGPSCRLPMAKTSIGNKETFHTRANQSNEATSSVPGRNVTRVLDRAYYNRFSSSEATPKCFIVEVTRAAPELAPYQPHLVLEEFSRGMH
ncbi:hypothetical protein [Niveibacterium terrae]|uniref:hypothetical protein n=1 Tax=Niveibacterium terrae TaxID=3373598 RepID=UPI003A8E201B